MFGGDAASKATPKTWPTSRAVTFLRCGSSTQCSPAGGRPGARRSTMLPTVPAGSITTSGLPSGPLTDAVPEKRVAKASPGRSKSCCAAAGSIVIPANAAKTATAQTEK